MQSIKSKLKERSLIGAWSVTGSATVFELLCSAGCDFLIADFEHGSFTLDQLRSCLRTAVGYGISVIVRPPFVDQTITQAAFDLGAAGVIYPQVSSASEAARAVKMSIYAPDGSLGFNPFTRAYSYGAPKGESDQVDCFWRAIIIETEAAWTELDQILEIPALDAVYLGVYDMSVALGIPGQVDHAKIYRFVEDVSARAKRAGKSVSLMARSPEQIELAKRVGADLIVCGVDSEMMRSAAAKVFAASR
ncbi:MAG: hypothetical protein IPJ84_13525 [Bdellovibrionales bacterium]|nr:hypothetical protein [Bdellovibrionales bacterium]